MSKKKSKPNNKYTSTEELFNLLNNPPKIEIDKDFQLEKQALNANKTERSEEQKLRYRKLADKRNKFVYDKNKKVLHDKSCILVDKIADTDFDMTVDIDKSMKLCRQCRLKALVRNRIDDESKINKMITFLVRINARWTDIEDLLKYEESEIKWISPKMIQVHVHDDTWRIELGYNYVTNKLWHNNYSWEGAERVIDDGFHLQNIWAKGTFHNIVSAMLHYKLSNHEKIIRKMIREEDSYLEMAPQNLVKVPEEDTFSYEIVFKLKKFSLINDYYMYIDIKKRFGKQFFEDEKIKYNILSEYESDKFDYVFVSCSIPKWYRGRMNRIFNDIKTKMYLYGYDRGYLCSRELEKRLVDLGYKLHYKI